MATENSKTRKAYRQGELLFVPVGAYELKRLEYDPNDRTYPSWNKLGTNVIREGEATGHKHEVIEQTAGTATMLEPARQLLPGLPDMDMIGSEDRLLTVKEPVEVVHPEHRPLNLPVGIYLIIVQREYDEVKARRIMD
ncbi:MAG: hypothetical protein Q7T18_12195 [Sedimentisphaerales bacterium]|nr:hypothetical protein [Sedimentisphaerales bacterium]